MSKKIKIAVTGGIGSGKSLFADFFIQKGFTVLKADDISKSILEKDVSVKELIEKYFGKESYHNDGTPNKKYIAQKIFNSDENLSIINSILHPPTIDRINKLMNKELQKKDLVFCEAALIYEADIAQFFDYVVLVTADKSIRTKRIMERDKTSESEVSARMEKQLSEEKKKELADFVIENNGTQDELIKKCNFFLILFNSLTK